MAAEKKILGDNQPVASKKKDAFLTGKMASFRSRHGKNRTQLLIYQLVVCPYFVFDCFR